MKPICVPCQRFFRPKRNGVKFVEQMPRFNAALPGNLMPSAWQPYKLWGGDLWECNGCGAEIIVGVAAGPIREHFHHDFAQVAEAFGAAIHVNDC